MPRPPGSAPEGTGKKRLLAWLRAAFALGLLAFGASLIPWNDRLVWLDDGKAHEVPGTIVGSWRSDAVGFRADPGADVDAAWPDEIESGLKTGSEVAVTRSPEDGPEDAGRLDWKPGMLRVFREVDPRGLAGAFLLITGAALIAITRWWRLLWVAGCPMRWSSALRLSFLGFFFNVVLPAGITGGDVVKAVLVVRENPDRRADAFVTVLVDRALGLLVLMGLAAVVVLVSHDRFAELKLPVVLTFLGVLLVLWILLHPASRRVLGISYVLERLPQQERLRAVERALRMYSEHPLDLLLAVVLSAGNHVCIGGSIAVLGHAFGNESLNFLEYLGVAAIANTISSVPITPSGWGVGEWAFGSLFHVLGAPSTLGVAVSVTYRLLSMLLGLAGGVFLVMPGGRGVRKNLQDEKDLGPGVAAPR